MGKNYGLEKKNFKENNKGIKKKNIKKGENTKKLVENSPSYEGYSLPQDTSKAFNENLNITLNNENFNLQFNKYIKYNEDFKHEFNWQNNKRLFYYSGDLYKHIKNKVCSICKCYENQNYFKLEIARKISSRMVVGLGEVSTREVSIKLDHVYGIPFISATSLKGAFKDFLAWEENHEDLVKEVFGTEDNRGKVIFTDTYPEEGFELRQDVMTPHYVNYYSEGKSPTDDQSPIPIKFITLEKAKFKFNLFISNDLKNKKEDIKKKFNEFLNESSIGAKASVGYGYFKDKGGSSSGKSK